MQKNELLETNSCNSNNWLDGYKSKLLSALFFGFPLFAVSVRHWASAIFIFVFLFTLPELKKIKCRLDRKAILFAAAAAGFFVAYVVSGVMNDWGREATRYFEREVRFLMILPILLAAIRGGYIKSFSYGAASAVIVNFIMVLYQYHYLEMDWVMGIYGPLFTGPFTVVMFAVFSSFFRERIIRQRSYFFYWLALLVSTVMVSIYTSRSALFALIFFVVIFIFKHYQWKLALTILMLSMVTGLVGLQTLGGSTQTQKLSDAFAEVADYVTYEFDHPGEINKYADTSIGKRLELLKGTYYLVADNPFFGVGVYMYQHRIEDYIKQNNLHPGLAHSNHPHNVFATVMASKGMLGSIFFFVMIWILVAPIKYGGALEFDWKLVVLTLLLTMMTEASIILKNNLISTFILVSVVAIAASKRAPK